MNIIVQSIWEGHLYIGELSNTRNKWLSLYIKVCCNVKNTMLFLDRIKSDIRSWKSKLDIRNAIRFKDGMIVLREVEIWT